MWRRVLYRFVNTPKEPEVFVTSKVNYGDRPAGCIAVVLVQETVVRFSIVRKEAAYRHTLMMPEGVPTTKTMLWQYLGTWRAS